MIAKVISDLDTMLCKERSDARGTLSDLPFLNRGRPLQIVLLTLQGVADGFRSDPTVNRRGG